MARPRLLRPLSSRQRPAHVGQLLPGAAGHLNDLPSGRGEGATDGAQHDAGQDAQPGGARRLEPREGAARPDCGTNTRLLRSSLKWFSHRVTAVIFGADVNNYTIGFNAKF